MNEKRFEISKDKYSIFDNLEDDFLDFVDVVNKLNAFAEEIKEFKKVRINDVKDFSALDKQNYDLKKENEKLKDDVYDELEKALKILEEMYEDYPKDNVHHLHSRLKGLLEELDE